MTDESAPAGNSQTDGLPSAEQAALLLPNVVSARFGQDSVLWSIIGSFWSSNAILLVALGATGTWASEPSLIRLLCLTGLFVSFLWWIMQAAALRRVIYYESLTTELEKLLGVAEALRLFGSNPEASTAGASRLPKARTMMPLGPLLALLGWGLGSYMAFVGIP